MQILKKQKLLAFITIITIGFLMPQNFIMPVKNATKNDYNQKSFWYYPWGKSVTHKGVDIFAKNGTKVTSSVPGIVLYTGENSLGGKFVLVLGAKWKLHYFAHLNRILTSPFSWVNHKTNIGKIGTSGNAKGKAPHLHYSIISLFPYIWKYDSKSKQGYKKMFYINPTPLLNTSFKK